MKTIMCFIGLMICVNALANCPDFSGEYVQDAKSCEGDLKKRSPWPLINQREQVTVSIVQDGCNDIQLQYEDSRFSNRPLSELNIDLREAKLLVVDEFKMNMTFLAPKSRVSYFGHTMRAKEELKLILRNKDGHILEITTISKTTGAWDYVIPIINKDKTVCRLIKK